MTTDSSRTFAAGFALLEAAMVEARVEHALSMARVAKLQAAAVLEQAGRMEEARAILADVRAEQEGA
jgi:hypothetical protein